MVKQNAARQLDSLFHALADPTRRSILRALASRDKTVGQIAEPFPFSLAAVSKHLNVLQRAELIARERRGNFQIVKLRADKLRPAEQWLAYYEKFWGSRLDALQQLMEGDSNG